MIGGCIGPLSLSHSLGVCEEDMEDMHCKGVKWSGMDWLCAISVYSRFEKAAFYGALFCKCVFV